MTDEAILAIAVLMFVVTPALIMGAGAIVICIDHYRSIITRD
jgi:hypothetical protein